VEEVYLDMGSILGVLSAGPRRLGAAMQLWIVGNAPGAPANVAALWARAAGRIR
jgi:hypothetical protein